MSKLTQQELSALDSVIELRTDRPSISNDTNNLTSNYVTPSNNSSILKVDESEGLTGGEGLPLGELVQLRGHSFT